MKIFPVVHVNEDDVFGTVRESKRAFNSGADGIYLVDRDNGSGKMKPLFNSYYSILSELPDKYIGLNILDLNPYEAVQALSRALNRSKGLIPSPSALWVNDMRKDYLDIDKMSAIELKNSNPRLQQIRLVGGIAYKNTELYTDNSDSVAYETLWLRDAVDIILTSGPTSNREPSMDKLVVMREVSEGKPIALDGGITFENIHQYAGIVDEALVSTIIETTPGSGKIDQAKLEKLVEIAHSLAK